MIINTPGLITSLVKEEIKQDKKMMAHASVQQTAKLESGDTVTLTDTATRLQRIEQMLVTQPLPNDQRIEQLQQTINQGGPKISPVDLAAKILNFENDLNNARTGT